MGEAAAFGVPAIAMVTFLSDFEWVVLLKGKINSFVQHSDMECSHSPLYGAEPWGWGGKRRVRGGLQGVFRGPCPELALCGVVLGVDMTLGSGAAL